MTYTVGQAIEYTFHPGFGGGLIGGRTFPGAVTSVRAQGRGQEVGVRLTSEGQVLDLLVESSDRKLRPA